MDFVTGFTSCDNRMNLDKSNFTEATCIVQLLSAMDYCYDKWSPERAQHSWQERQHSEYKKGLLVRVRSGRPG